MWWNEENNPFCRQNDTAYELKCLALRPGHVLGLSLGQLSSKVEKAEQ